MKIINKKRNAYFKFKNDTLNNTPQNDIISRMNTSMANPAFIGKYFYFTSRKGKQLAWYYRELLAMTLRKF